MADEEQCEDLNNAIVGGPASWNYFNQPISQIEGFDNDVPQILTHGSGFGLTWLTPECIDVVTCFKYSGIKDSDTDDSKTTPQIEITRHKLLVLHDFGVATKGCDNVELETIPVVQCIAVSGLGLPDGTKTYTLEINRKNIFTFGSDEIEATTDKCDNISLSTKDVVECIKYNNTQSTSSSLDLERRKLLVFEDMPADTGCDNITLESIPVVKCITLGESGLEIDQTNALVIKDLGKPQEVTCSDIPITKCPEPSPSPS